MKKYILVFIIFSLVITTSIIKNSTRELENQFEFRQQGQEQLRQKVNEINKQRQEENKLIKQTL